MHEYGQTEAVRPFYIELLACSLFLILCLLLLIFYSTNLPAGRLHELFYKRQIIIHRLRQLFLFFISHLPARQAGFLFLILY